MRLPTATPRQVLYEDARLTHEAIWTAHLAGEVYLLPGDAEPKYSDRAAVFQGNFHSFWIARGYRLSVTLTPERRVAIRLVPAPAKQRRNTPKPETDLAWTGRVA